MVVDGGVVIGVVGLGMHGVVFGITPQACMINLARMTARPLKLSTKK